MLMALLALIGVDLVVIVVFVGIVLSRKRWVARQPGAFRGAIRVTDGEFDRLSPKWRRGYGRWVRDVLIWTKAPVLFRNELVPVDDLAEQRAAHTDEVKRLGAHPMVARLSVGTATVEVVAHGEEVELLCGPFGKPDGTVVAAGPAPTDPVDAGP